MLDNRARKKKLNPITFSALAESLARMEFFILLLTCLFGLTDRSSFTVRWPPGPCAPLLPQGYTSDRSRTVTQLQNCSETRWEEGK